MPDLDLGTVFDAPLAKSSWVDDTMEIQFTSFARADRARRQTIERIRECETPEQVREYVSAESLLIDAIHLFDPQMSASVTEAAQEQVAWTDPGNRAPRKPGNTTATRRSTLEKFSPFKKVMFKDVTFLYPKLDQPYRYNAAEKKSEPCAPKANGATYSIAWEMSLTDATAIAKEMMEHYKAATQHDTKLPKFEPSGERKTKVFGLKKVEKDDGTTVAQFTAKKRAVGSNGSENKPPVVVGPDLQPLEDKNIWTGSLGSVRVLAFPVSDPDGNGGISLLLDAVQVTQAVYGGDNLEDDFGPAQKPTLDDYETDAPTDKPAEVAEEDVF